MSLNLLSLDYSPKQNKSEVWIVLINNLRVDEIDQLKYQIVNKNKIPSSQLCTKKADFVIAHNFWWYDGGNLPCVTHQPSKVIDTLFLNAFFDFDKPYHHLDKSVANDPIEDAQNAWRLLKWILKKILTNGDQDLLNLIYSLTASNPLFEGFWQLILKIPNFPKPTKLQSADIQLYLKELFDIGLNVKNLSLNQKVGLAYAILFKKYNKPVLPSLFFEWEEDSQMIKNFKSEVKTFLNTRFKWLTSKYEQNQKNEAKANIKYYLKKYFNFDQFKSSLQDEGIRYALESKNFVTLLATWWGKSLIYQLPAMIIWDEMNYLTVVISPLKALINDHYNSLKKRRDGVDILTGDISPIEEIKVKERIKSGQTKLLLTSPEKLRSESFLHLLAWRYVDRFVIDEAHTLVHWGKEFRFDYFFVKDFLQDLQKEGLNNQINLTLLSATVPQKMLDEIKWYFGEREIKVLIWDNILKENIIPQIVEIEWDSSEAGFKKLKEILQQQKYNKVVVFVREKETAEKLKAYLENNFEVGFYHASVKTETKKEIEDKFKKWEIKIIIATKAFGMGVDIKDIDLVVHFNLPQSVEDYIQEIGRAGRGGQQAKNILFVNQEDISKSQKLVDKYKVYPHNLKRFIDSLTKEVKWKKLPKTILLSQTKIKKIAWLEGEKDLKTKIDFVIWFWEYIGVLKRRYNKVFVLANKIGEINFKDLSLVFEKIEKEVENQKWQQIMKWILKHMADSYKSLDLLNIDDVKLGLWWEIDKDIITKITDEEFKRIISNLQQLNFLIKIEKDADMVGMVDLEKLKEIKPKKRKQLLEVFKYFVKNQPAPKFYTSDGRIQKKIIISVGRLQKAVLDYYQNNERLDLKAITNQAIIDFLFDLQKQWIIEVTHSIQAFFTRYQLVISSSQILEEEISLDQIKQRLDKLNEAKKAQFEQMQEVIDILKNGNISQYRQFLKKAFEISK